ncbi:MAG: PaaI family thioesterase [Acidimicrobiia bacterium]
MLDVDAVDRLRDRYDTCFGCGSANPIGLHLDGFTVEGDDVIAPFSPRVDFTGFEGTLHGGIVATALDEISAWSAMFTHGVLVFTAKLDIRYRSQAGSDDQFEMRGTVIERRGRRLTIEGQMNRSGSVVAESSGLFIVAEELSGDAGLTTS